MLATLGTGASASMAAHHVARPPARPHALIHAGQNAASDPVVAFTQEFQKNTMQFCDDPNANPCDCAYNGGGNAANDPEAGARGAPASGMPVAPPSL